MLKTIGFAFGITIASAAGAQTTPAIEGPVYLATYVEILPAASSDGATRFILLAVWADQKAYEAHVAAAHTRQFRDKLGPMVGALYDERLYRSVD